MPTAATLHTAATPSREHVHTHAGAAAAGLFLAGAGVAFVVLAIAWPAALDAFYRLVASPGTATTMDAGTRFGAGLFGALTVGWGVTIRQIARGVPLTRAITVGTIAWFVVDSSASVLLGYAWNALSNVGFLVIVLWLLRRGQR